MENLQTHLELKISVCVRGLSGDNLLLKDNVKNNYKIEK